MTKYLSSLIKDFTVFEKCLIAANILLSMVFLIMWYDSGNWYWMWFNVPIIEYVAFISSIANTISVILVAKRRIDNYPWGLVAVSTYAAVGFAYGNTAVWTFQLAWYLPLIVIGWLFWSKNKSKRDTRTVEAKKMNLLQSVAVYSLTLAGIFAFAWLISLPQVSIFLYGYEQDFGFDKHFIDAASDILAIPAMILMVKRYREQWLFWILLNVFCIVLWSFYTFNPIMIVLWCTLLVNAAYGYCKWKVEV